MQFLAELWLPIVLSTVFVFIASCVVHMAIPLHKSEYKGVPDETRLREAVRAQNLPTGDYYFPWCRDMKEMRTPEMIQKFIQGPVGILTIRQSGPPGMTRNLVQWVLFTLIIAVLTAYLGDLALAPGAGFGPVLRVTSTAAFMAFAPAYVHGAIWKGTPWSTALRFVLDGLIYGLVVGATFAWLWPSV
jgi:hypothetical protein